MFFPMHCKVGLWWLLWLKCSCMTALAWRFVWPWWIPSHTYCTLKYSSLNKKLQTKKHLVAPSYMAGDLREMSTSSSESQPCHVHVHTFLRTFPLDNSASTRAPTASVAGASSGLMLMRQRLRPVARSFRLRLCCPGNLPIA